MKFRDHVSCDVLVIKMIVISNYCCFQLKSKRRRRVFVRFWELTIRNLRTGEGIGVDDNIFQKIFKSNRNFLFFREENNFFFV